MSNRQIFCLVVPLIVFACMEGCGAMTIEPAAPEEPPSAPATAPRLVRHDAGIETAAAPEAVPKSNEERP